MGAVQVKVACASSTDTDRGVSGGSNAHKNLRSYPPEAPVTSASLPLISLSTGLEIDMAEAVVWGFESSWAPTAGTRRAMVFICFEHRVDMRSTCEPLSTFCGASTGLEVLELVRRKSRKSPRSRRPLLWATAASVDHSPIASLGSAARTAGDPWSGHCSPYQDSLVDSLSQGQYLSFDRSTLDVRPRLLC